MIFFLILHNNKKERDYEIQKLFVQNAEKNLLCNLENRQKSDK